MTRGGVLAPALALCLSLLLLLSPRPVMAQPRLAVDYWGGVATRDGEPRLSRLTLSPSYKRRFGSGWSGDVAMRLELANDDTGLGSLNAYSPASEPLLRSRRARLEFDRALLRWRGERSVLTLGKQVVAWGALDGLQVADRFNPVRLRDFVFLDTRPDRLSRWGARLQRLGERWELDLALALDPTATQLADSGSAFSLRASRFRLGLPPAAPLQPLPPARDGRDDYLGDATVGARLGWREGVLEASVLVLDGPETEPVFAVGPRGLALDYPRRTLLGATVSASAGPTLWRLEAAHVPEQPFNAALAPAAATPPGLRTVRRARTLLGAGVDWNAPAGWFVNAQLVLDRVGNAGALYRSGRDLIATLRAQRGFAYDTLRVRGELLSSLDDADLVLRPALEWRKSDRTTLTLGADLVHGGRDDLFGQFERESRLWARIQWVF